MLVHDVPANILTLPRAVVAPQTAHTLPTRPPPAQTAGPPTSAHAPLLERATRAAIERHEGTDKYGNHGTQPSSTHDRCSQLPSRMRTTQCRQHVWGHRVEPIVIGHYVVVGSHSRAAVHDVVTRRGARRRGRQRVLGTAGFTIQPVPRAGMTRSAPPLFNAKVMHKRHRPRAVARGKEGIFGGGMV